MAELAESVHHSRSRLTHTISRMESAGLVERRSCPSDRRGVLAKLTDEGYERLVEAAPIHVAGVRDGFVDLVSDADFEAIGRAFKAVINRDGATAGPGDASIAATRSTPSPGADERSAT
jgi:DNA-binding MarR family transcriptional regulator